MLATLGLLAVDFVLGVSLTALIAAGVIGMIRAEAVRIVDGHLSALDLGLRSHGVHANAHIQLAPTGC